MVSRGVPEIPYRSQYKDRGLSSCQSALPRYGRVLGRIRTRGQPASAPAVEEHYQPRMIRIQSVKCGMTLTADDPHLRVLIRAIRNRG